MNRRNLLSLCYFIPAVLLIGACSNTSKYLSEPMPESGFLPNYKLLPNLSDLSLSNQLSEILDCF